MMFFETSAKTAEHVNECFMNLTGDIVKELAKNQVKRPDQAQNIDLSARSADWASKGKGYCC